jgi:hypothetical protein
MSEIAFTLSGDAFCGSSPYTCLNRKQAKNSSRV